jgi:GAF domain-containing protein
MTGPGDAAEATPPALDPASVDLDSALTQMAGLALSRETVETALQLVTRLAATATRGSLGAAVTVVDESGTRSRAASDQLVEKADALQYEFDEGPCLTAWRTQEVVRIDDTATDVRWPSWNGAARRMGVRSVLSAPLLSTGESIGAMKVYSARPLNYGPHEEHVMRLLAHQAAILMANSQSLQEARSLSRRLTEALATRDVVSHAIGVLLARALVARVTSSGERAAGS